MMRSSLVWALFIFLIGQLPFSAGQAAAETEKATWALAQATWAPAQDCQSGTLWRWGAGKRRPDIARKAMDAFLKNKIDARVNAYEYGEYDDCENFHLAAIDYTLDFPAKMTLGKISHQTPKIKEILDTVSGFPVGTVQILKAGAYQRAASLYEPFAPPRTPETLSGAPSLSEASADTAELTWQPVGTVARPAGRSGAGWAYDAQRKVSVLFGGEGSGSARFQDTWEFSGENWIFRLPTQSPPGRTRIRQAVVYDAARGRTVVFGGLAQELLDDTWEYDGKTWSQVDSALSPPARDDHAMAYDPEREKTILYGGSPGYGDTWEYDGSWVQQNPAHTPGPRSQHAMVYDELHHQMVLFGGVNGAEYLGDTWIYDGEDWRQVFPAHTPEPRQAHGMVYDRERGVVVLFGGYNQAGDWEDTWEYNGTDWKAIRLALSPSRRSGVAMVYDPVRRKTFLWGGQGEADALPGLDDTYRYPEDTRVRKVLEIVYNPTMSDGAHMIDYFHWNSPAEITAGTIDFFQRASAGKLNYQVVASIEVDEFPVKQDGFRYTASLFADVITHRAAAHRPDAVDYNAIVNDPDFDICGRANRGEIDEVWIYNGPYFGFWESTLVGPGAYTFNSPPVADLGGCQRLVPIMGPNPERYLGQALENFGHRTEDTLKRVYGSGQIGNPWGKFSLVDSLSNEYAYSGCGSVHYPPNGQADYDWDNPEPAQTYCADFVNYPRLSSPETVLETVTCSTWGCGNVGYFQYWWSHFPARSGCGLDEIATNWWAYIMEPHLANTPLLGCAVSDPASYQLGYFNKSGPEKDAPHLPISLVLAWLASNHADHYEVCYDTTDNQSCDGAWQEVGLNPSVELNQLAYGTTYFWQVRAVNHLGSLEANGGWWSFTTQPDLPSPFAKEADPPKSFSSFQMLIWQPSAGADSYEYCLDQSDNQACDGEWQNTGAHTQAQVGPLAAGQAYFWQVRSVNPTGITYANQGTWMAFSIPHTTHIPFITR